MNKSKVKPVATRSSNGPGSASDILNCDSPGKESGTREEKHPWWCVDLGENRRLIVTHFALRHGRKDGRQSVLQKWEFQGSIDGEQWEDIKYNCGTPKFVKPSPFFKDRRTVQGKVKAFRYFRILQTDRNLSGRFGIYLSGLELYGLLTTLAKESEWLK